MHYRDFIVGTGVTVADAMKQLETSGQKIIFIESDDKLVGVLTDGDVRRYLLAGSDLDANVMQAASRDPVTVQGFHEQTARKLVRDKELSCVPMTDNAGRAHALVFLNQTVHREVAPVDTPVIIMAGGMGTRLYPYTNILPKPLIPAGSATITEQIISRFKKFGCYDFYLVVNHKRNLIKSYFSEVDTGANLTFIDEDKPLGTGGGLSFFKGQFDRPVILTYCDNIIEADYAELLRQHREEGNIFTMVCAKKSFTVPYGVVETDGTRMVSLKEKPCIEMLTNAGLYVVSPAFIDLIPDDTFTPITDIVEKCRDEGERVGVYVIEEECFIDIGQIEDLRSVEEKLK